MSDATQLSGGAIRVGDFIVDPRSGELRGEAGRQVLSAQPLHVLLALAERPGELVTREQLRARLWPADTYVDFEHGLNAVVKRLRDALGDSADQPRYIETVPRRGYRLVAPVYRNAGRAAGASVGSSPAVPPVRVDAPVGRRRVRRWVAAIGASVLALAGMAYMARWREAEAGADTPAAPAAHLHPIRITYGAGLQTDPTWAPDGRRIAFAWDRDGNFDIYTQHVDGGEPTRITSSPANDTQPAWSPDGGRLVFRSGGEGGGLFTVGANGGPIRRVTSVGARPVWMPGGREIAYADRDRLMQAIYLVRPEGGDPPREILKGELTGGTWGSFTVHPDGRIGVLGRHPTQPLGIHVSDPSHRRLAMVATAAPMLPEWGASFTRAHWSPEGTTIFVEAWTAGVTALWRVPVDPSSLAWEQPVQITAAPMEAEHAAISPDGTRLAFASPQKATRAWVFPFDADTPAPPGEGRAYTDEGASVSGLYLNADSSAIYYAEDRPGRDSSRGLRTDLATGATTLLADDIVSGVVPSADGRAVAYSLRRRVPGKPIEFALAWRDGSGHERLLSPWGGSIALASDWRRDGGAVLATFMKEALTGPASLVEWPIGPGPASAPGRVVLEARAGAFWQGRYSPDGRWVAFVASGLGGDVAHELGIVRAEGGRGAWARVAADHPEPDKPRWSPNGRTLYFLSRKPSGYLNLWAVRIDPSRGAPAGAPRQLTTFDSPRWHVEPNLSFCELAVARGRMALPMRTVTGSIWMLPTARDRSPERRSTGVEPPLYGRRLARVYPGTFHPRPK